MKSAKIVVGVLIAASVLYGLGYWVFIRQGIVSMLPTGSDDPFDTAGLRGAVNTLYKPARELDLRLTVDAPLRKQLIGHWRSEPTGDFVTISPDYTCKFRLGRFEHEGVVKFERDYAGYSTDFGKDDVTYVFIFSFGGGFHTPPQPENVATAFVGHDPVPGHREGVYEIPLAKQAEQNAGANRLPAPQAATQGGARGTRLPRAVIGRAFSHEAPTDGAMEDFWSGYCGGDRVVKPVCLRAFEPAP